MLSTTYKSLSKKQREIVFSTLPKAIVRACPGSGKTYTVAARLAYLLENWGSDHTGIACLSFTNVAWQEIEKYLLQFDVVTGIKYPHFLGTIDSFINQYIFLPFGHLVMGNKKRPIMVGEPYSPWSSKYYFETWFDKISIDINENFFFTQPYPRPRKSSQDSIFKTKQKLLDAGFANQNDANFFALQILQKYPQITSCLAIRFPILLIDEAQDTTEVQMAIFKLLESELKQILLIGDPDQAIFEWNDADPKIFSSKCKDNKYNLYELDECRRSSQRICNFVYKLSALLSPAIASTPEICDCKTEPKIVEFSSKPDLVNEFRKTCQKYGVLFSVDNVALLSRTKAGVNELVRTFTPDECVQTTPKLTQSMWKDDFLWCKKICEGKYLLDQNMYKEGYRLIERGFYSAISDNPRFSIEDLKKHIETTGFLAWRKTIHDFIQNLPNTNKNIIDWLNLFKPISLAYFGTPNVQKAIKRGFDGVLINKIFDQLKNILVNVPVRIGTIHSVKGETFEAVLVMIGNKAKSTKYSTILGRIKEGELREEELRILYVALTRAKKLLFFGVPKGDGEMWEKFMNTETLI